VTATTTTSQQTTLGPSGTGDIEAAIVKEVGALRVAIARHRIEREPGPVHVGYYGDCCVRREALARRLSDVHGTDGPARTPGTAALQMLDDELLAMARATTTRHPETPFER
jgi:hypothetical protein